MPLSSDQQLLIIIGLIAAIPVLLGIRRRREGIRYRLRKVLIVEGIYLGLAYIMLRNGQPPLESILAGLVAAFIVNSFIKPRSRYIPASVKRKAKAEFELKTGTKFNPRKHEYDHDVPFSRGGSHTMDNIRVVERKKNRSKGSKSAWWDVLGK
ncbi:MAG TPA: HNH endonuclease signature motif containing protein [Candidatus Acidoferrales bacterium]|nr:HNH endonuclease signature motif containing protein [Candidatus Acidoferrales bacterium]